MWLVLHCIKCRSLCFVVDSGVLLFTDMVDISVGFIYHGLIYELILRGCFVYAQFSVCRFVQSVYIPWLNPRIDGVCSR